MAGIDSSIYFQQQPLDIMGSIQKGLSMRDMVDKRNNQKSMQDAYKAGMVTGPDGKVTFDGQKTMSALAGSGLGQEAYEFGQKQKAQDAEAQKAQRELMKQNAESIARYGMTAMQNPSMWPQVRAQIIQEGLAKENEIPMAYDPNFVQMQVGRAMSITDQFGRMDKDQENVRKENESKANVAKTKAETSKIYSELGGGKDGAAPKMTEAQSKALGFGRRAMLADQMLDKITSDPKSDVTSLKTQIKSNLPKWMGGAKSPQEQSLNVAKLSFISAVLRKESGAAVTPEEFSQYDRIYFPQPGDSPQALEEKKQLRANFIDTEKLTAGNAWRDPVQSQPQAPKSSGPKIGTVEDGYRFRGGNPSDPNSWEKL